MAGSNPYVAAPKTEQASQKFNVTFRIGGESKTFEIDPANLPSGGAGLRGSILDLALGLEVDIDHACGGVCACSTCHVVVRQGLATCNPSTDDEEDQLEKAPGLTAQSRLACQIVPNGKSDLVVEVPNWNRNAARE